MAISNCAFNSAAALRRVFIPSNLETSTCLHVTRVFVPALLPPAQQQQTRTYSWWENPNAKAKAGTWASGLEALSRKTRSPAETASILQPPRRPPKNLNKPGPRVTAKLARLPRNEEIREKYVHIKQWDADGTEGLSRPQLVKEILARLDRKTESLEVVAQPNEADPESPEWPVAKIVNRKAELAQKQKLKESDRKQAAHNKEKELEFNWALAPHDIEHKLRTLKKFLAKGMKVQVMLMNKSGKGAKASKKEAEALLEKVVEALAEVTGSMEFRSREGRILGTMKLFLQGKMQQKEDVAVRAEEPTKGE